MGIIEGVKLWNNNPDATEPVKNILKDFITFQENTVEKLKKYLRFYSDIYSDKCYN